MPTDQIVALLMAERDKLDAAIEALQGPLKGRGRPPKAANEANTPDWVKPAAAKTTAPKKRTMSAAGRKRIGDAARKRWAAIKAGKAKSPFATKKRASTKSE
jgi:hypothetical protein